MNTASPKVNRELKALIPSVESASSTSAAAGVLQWAPRSNNSVLKVGLVDDLELTLADITPLAPLNAMAIATQDSTGGHAVTLANVAIAGGTQPTIASAAGAASALRLAWTGDQWILEQTLNAIAQPE